MKSNQIRLNSKKHQNLTGDRNSRLVTATKHGGIVSNFSAALSSSVTGFKWKPGWVTGAARPWAASSGSGSTVSSANTSIETFIVFQSWVKGVWSESFVENVQNKVRFNSARPDSTVIPSVFSFAINLNLFWNGS